MADQPDKANVIVRPPIALLLAFLAGLLADWLYPVKLLPALRNSRHDTFAPVDSYGFPVWADWSVPHVLLGSFIFVAGFALMVWAISTIRVAGTHVETTQPTTAIVAEGPYRFSRNPLYLAMGLGLVGLAIGFNTVWVLIALVPFYLIIRYGVIALEEAYLNRKFGDVYRGYQTQVRRWL